jgi:hypothetical protein
MSLAPLAPRGGPDPAYLLLLLALARCGPKGRAAVRVAGKWAADTGSFIEGIPLILEFVTEHLTAMLGSVALERVRRIGREVSGTGEEF